MANKSNVDPNHYKTAGRGPQGQAVPQEAERLKLKEQQSRASRGMESPAPVPRPKKAPATASKPLAELEKGRRKRSGE